MLAVPYVAVAQSAPMASRPVVQGVPSGDSQRLSAALTRIARDPRDASALIDAGDAANAMGDPEAAAGFYKRADGISPNNVRVMAGLARALVLQGKPTEAIPLFAVAERGGAAQDVTSDRGLAYDLVGDPVTAQRYYQAALARRDEDEVRRRLGISLAITGDAAGSDAMLMPLLRKQDKPAWRAHAFALAIAGKTKEAVDTVNAILPARLAQSVTPYLRYMPRLTRSQQAAAGNLGRFPRASEIGQDDPAIAAYAPTMTRVAAADTKLIPRGKPLGGARSRAANVTEPEAAPLTSRERRVRDRQARLAQAEAVAAARVAPPDIRPTIGRDDRGDDGGELPALGTSTRIASAPTTTTALHSPIAQPLATPSVSSPAPATGISSSRVAGVVPATPRHVPLPTRAAGAAVVRANSLEQPVATARPDPAPAFASPSVAVASPAPVQRQPLPNPQRNFDLANVGTVPQPGPVLATTAAPAAMGPTAATPSGSTSERRVSLEQAFADLGAPSRTPAPVAGAVDVRAIVLPKPAPSSELVKLEAPRSEPGRSAGVVSRVSKATSPKAGAARAADVEEPAGEKKRGAAAQDAKLADAKKGDARKLDGKKGDPKKADAKKVLPSHPSRIWVQVGVGRDKAAIGYDWRKFVKDNPATFKGRQPYISDMGRTNRILAGPFETQKAANDLVTKLKKADVAGAFVWNSPAGQVVDPLTVK